MLASIPVNEMAETLRVLAGGNAANAARHFTNRSYERGDVSAAVLWSSIARVLAGALPAPETELELTDPAPISLIREGIALQGVRYEDVDAETLAREEPPASVVAPPGACAARPIRFDFVRAGRTDAGVEGGCAGLDAPGPELAQAA